MLEVSRLEKRYESRDTLAIADLTFSAERGEFLSIVGPSGAGKTTLLKCVCGLLPLSGGKVLLNGRPVYKPPPEMVLVFQDYSRSLYPWLSVLKNVLFALAKKQEMDQESRLSLAERMLDAVGLKGFSHHYPWELSGGMQQRVALARALAFQPEILLMDEPFASVDAQTRADLEDLLLSLWEKFSITILFVTHDIEEATYLSDRILVLSASPARTIAELLVGLPRPRDQIETRSSPRFMELREILYHTIKGKSRPAETKVPVPDSKNSG
ncbi:MAG: ABC transporter ATP-binding protein [Candidatus Tectomicrobia bacterium]|uniref:ABC transporter ATP-binding protein n=1 Tax=Tectimicrobiota bacterium TaxID=2528274 RepID=A0A932GQD8_UNCTE|nr:ABC transporter ATP-binding protein [Candidatus Tectomicrobia bacterium]